MSAMEKMFGDMLKKAIPPEVMELLTKEKIEEIGEQCKAFMQSIFTRFDDLERQNNTIIENQQKILELLENGKSGRKTSGSGGRNSGGSDSGSS